MENIIMLSSQKPIRETAHHTTIASQHLFYRTAGTGSPLVLLHGYGVSGYMWQRVLPSLVHQHQVFLVDLPGHGQSRFTGSWKLREVASLLAHWLQALRLPPVALMGQSMGGAIALHLSATAPELVQRLILVSSAGLPMNASFPTLVTR